MNAVEMAIDNKNWYAALAVVLNLPDICIGLELGRRTCRQDYINWWDKYLSEFYVWKTGAIKEFTFLSGKDAYALRCAYLHEGLDDITNHNQDVLTKFLFKVPPPTGSMHCIQSDSALLLQIDIFCIDVCNGVRKWLLDIKNNEEIRARMERLIIIHDFR